MLRKSFAAAFAAALTLVFAHNANAALFTSNGDFALKSDQDGAAPISDIEILSLAGATGRIYTNQVSGGTPFGLGSEIRTISASRVDAATDGIQHSSVEFADGDKLIIVSAIRGTITDVGPGGLQTATFTEGRAFAIKISPAGFDARNPETFDNGTIVAEYSLLPQQPVVPTALGANVMFQAFQTNQSSINSQSPQQSQGVFLFSEDSQPGQNPGDNLLSNVDNSLPPGFDLESEALISDIDQTVLFTDLEDYDDPGIFGAADLAVLNALAELAGFTDLGAAGTGFATGLGGAGVTDFNPQFPDLIDGAGPTGDFFATYGADNYVALQSAIPEPSSVVLFALGAGVLVALGRRGKKQDSTTV